MMNTREFFEAVANTTTDECVREYAIDRIEKLNERNEKRRSKAREMKPEDIEMLETIKSVLSETPQTAAQILSTSELHITVNKVTSLVKKIDSIVITPVKIDGRYKNAYAIAQ